MRPKEHEMQGFLDGGNPEETKAVLKQIGFLDGQTTNPTLIAKNPEARKRLEQGNNSARRRYSPFITVSSILFQVSCRRVRSPSRSMPMPQHPPKKC